MGQLDGRAAVITGGARGQGRSHAVLLAGEGADIVLADLAAPLPGLRYPLATPDDLAETAELVRAAGGRCHTVRADVRSRDDMERVAAEALREFGRIDILLANAGIATHGTIADLDERTWRDTVDVDLSGVFHSIKAVLPTMLERRWGRIVATSSIVGRMGATGSGAYAAAKWGVIGLIKSLALEVGESGITANAVLPSGVRTDMVMNPATYRVLLPDLENPTRADAEAMFAKGGGLIEPEEVSRLVLLLVGPHGGRFNGEALSISDGMSGGTV
ncbi:mycofactocin-coupled SDR family oxidoreductase [Nocardia sp. NPDC057227]|uniref:mycofactocin-coupled SDR family oxidoreductase n=1 Tax=Nocardia sp. NPDC057227 TaxID=3346056 RepID=UPI00363DD2CF